MGEAPRVEAAAVQQIVKLHARTYHRGGPATANSTRYKGSGHRSLLKKLLKRSVKRVGANIVEVCCRKTTPGLKSHEFLRIPELSPGCSIRRKVMLPLRGVQSAFFI